MDNGAMENFFGRLKVEMFYGEKFESVNAFIEKLHEYIYYYNNERISRKLKGMSPVQIQNSFASNLIKFFVQLFGRTSKKHLRGRLFGLSKNLAISS